MQAYNNNNNNNNIDDVVGYICHIKIYNNLYNNRQYLKTDSPQSFTAH
jgi:hypothetical protein